MKKLTKQQQLEQLTAKMAIMSQINTIQQQIFVALSNGDNEKVDSLNKQLEQLQTKLTTSTISNDSNMPKFDVHNNRITSSKDIPSAYNAFNADKFLYNGSNETKTNDNGKTVNASYTSFENSDISGLLPALFNFNKRFNGKKYDDLYKLNGLACKWFRNTKSREEKGTKIDQIDHNSTYSQLASKTLSQYWQILEILGIIDEADTVEADTVEADTVEADTVEADTVEA